MINLFHDYIHDTRKKNQTLSTQMGKINFIFHAVVKSGVILLVPVELSSDINIIFPLELR